jgi:hypothetical protein
MSMWIPHDFLLRSDTIPLAEYLPPYTCVANGQGNISGVSTCLEMSELGTDINPGSHGHFASNHELGGRASIDATPQ